MIRSGGETDDLYSINNSWQYWISNQFQNKLEGLKIQYLPQDKYQTISDAIGWCDGTTVLAKGFGYVTMKHCFIGFGILPPPFCGVKVVWKIDRKTRSTSNHKPDSYRGSWRVFQIIKRSLIISWSSMNVRNLKQQNSVICQIQGYRNWSYGVHSFIFHPNRGVR